MAELRLKNYLMITIGNSWFKIIIILRPKIADNDDDVGAAIIAIKSMMAIIAIFSMIMATATITTINIKSTVRIRKKVFTLILIYVAT